jgi:hypothetical protein
MLFFLRRLAVVMALAGLCVGCGRSTEEPAESSSMRIGPDQIEFPPEPPALPPLPRT